LVRRRKVYRIIRSRTSRGTLRGGIERRKGERSEHSEVELDRSSKSFLPPPSASLALLFRARSQREGNFTCKDSILRLIESTLRSRRRGRVERREGGGEGGEIDRGGRAGLRKLFLDLRRGSRHGSRGK